jgi:arylsulfatase A-like enzyme
MSKLWAGGLLVALAAGCSGGGDERPRSVLLITLDTTRYNALGCYGNPKKPTPALDRLASEGVVFEQARTVTPLTLPAHASMLTGLYPVRHTLVANGLRALPQSATTAAELARRAGVQTAAFVAAVVLDSAMGLDQGFEVYADPPREDVTQTHKHPELEAPAIVAAAQSWLDARDRSRPYFAWLHFFDPHAPYAPPQELAQQLGSPYLGEVAYVDRALDSLLAKLRADGTLDETTVIVVGDHGEGLNTKLEPTHGWYCYEGTLRVPLLIRFPGAARAGERSREFVSVVDVFPTVLDALGLDTPAGVDGRSLTLAQPDSTRGVYFELYHGFLSFGWSPIAGWVDARGKYIHSSDPEFYELESDRAEAKNVIAARGDDAARARSAMAALRARPKLKADERAELGEDVRAALRSLGYAGVDAPEAELPDPLATSSLPSPQSRRDEMLLFNRSQELAEQGQDEEVAQLLGDLIRRFPENMLARVHLANTLIRLQRTAEARELLEELVLAGRAQANDYNSLGWCREQAGDTAGAVEAYGRALELDSGQPWARQNLERLRAKR